MAVAKSLTLGLVILVSAILLVVAWLDFVGLGNNATEIDPPTLYQQAEIPASLAIVVLLQFLFAWLTKAPSVSTAAYRDSSGTRNAWKRVWTRLFVSFCWTLILAILLFVIRIFTSNV